MHSGLVLCFPGMSWLSRCSFRMNCSGSEADLYGGPLIGNTCLECLFEMDAHFRSQGFLPEWRQITGWMRARHMVSHFCQLVARLMRRLGYECEYGPRWLNFWLFSFKVGYR